MPRPGARSKYSMRTRSGHGLGGTNKSDLRSELKRASGSSFLTYVGSRLARYLASSEPGAPRRAPPDRELFHKVLRTGDVLLVEGSSRFSTAIKYLTQSSWSHAALFVGNALDPLGYGDAQRVLVDADINHGVRAVPLSTFLDSHTRICRPVGLSEQEIDAVVNYVVSRIGHQYDLQNIIDLVRYLLPAPPVPTRWRRRMISLGSGDPTRAICSSLIAQAFQSVRYPILPDMLVEKFTDPECIGCYREILHIRESSLFAPRDFDVSPYFRIVKPALESGFDPHDLRWDDDNLVQIAN